MRTKDVNITDAVKDRKVGPTGRAIGIDMTEEMLARARRNAEQAGLSNVEFHLARIEDLPLADASVDCVISNCVLNLVPDKARAFREIFRALKPPAGVKAPETNWPQKPSSSQSVT